MNLPTFIISAIVLAIIVIIIISMHKRKKSGSPCSGGWVGCKSNGGCYENATSDTNDDDDNLPDYRKPISFK